MSIFSWDWRGWSSAVLIELGLVVVQIAIITPLITYMINERETQRLALPRKVLALSVIKRLV
jgi:hypothetical protein